MQAFKCLARNILNPFRTNLTFQLLQKPQYSFALMALFEPNKKAHELDPVFKRKTRLPGHLRSKRKTRHVSPKLNPKIRELKPKLKNRPSMLNRVKIVGPSWNRQFKFRSPGKRHLMRNKSRANLNRKSRARYIHKADINRVKKLIPYFKRKSLKQKY